MNVRSVLDSQASRATLLIRVGVAFVFVTAGFLSERSESQDLEMRDA